MRKLWESTPPLIQNILIVLMSTVGAVLAVAWLRAAGFNI